MVNVNQLDEYARRVARGERWVKLDHITDNATMDTVNLYNTCLPIYFNKKGRFVWEAVAPYGKGVFVRVKQLKG